jgi:hypothetical protein
MVTLSFHCCPIVAHSVSFVNRVIRRAGEWVKISKTDMICPIIQKIGVTLAFLRVGVDSSANPCNNKKHGSVTRISLPCIFDN